MSAFSEAIMANLVGSLDPRAAAEREYMTSVIDVQKQNLIDMQGKTIEKLTSLIVKAKESDAPLSVIEAYERLLAKASAV